MKKLNTLAFENKMRFERYTIFRANLSKNSHPLASMHVVLLHICVLTFKAKSFGTTTFIPVNRDLLPQLQISILIDKVRKHSHIS